MLTVARKTFSLIFVSKKQKLKISQGAEAPAEATSAFEMVPPWNFIKTPAKQRVAMELRLTPRLRAVGKL